MVVFRWVAAAALALPLIGSELTQWRLLGIMSNMKKVSAREFQHHFGKLTENLKPGQSIQVMKRGKVDGIYQKARQARVKQPNFLETTDQHPYSEKIGARLVKRLDEAFS